MSLADLDADDWPALSALLDEALALPQAERAGFVDALGPEHAERRETLRALLAHAARVETGDFLVSLPAIALPPQVLPGGVEAAAQPAPGAEVGPYRLIEELGSGGMGAVWLAERADGSLKRKVALKLPRLSWDPSFAQRSLRERDILAALEHPHIARLYDAGVDALGRPFLAMEHVRGQPINAWCDARRLPLAARVELLRQVADAVAYAHRRLVVHRDLKPSNILVTDDGQVRLLDFGIARLLGAEGAPAAEHTLAAPAFTINYASPEQLQGQPLSTATDIYSLGVVAHELLCGARPFDHLPERGAARVQAILATEPGLPSRRMPGAEAAAARASTPAALQRSLRGDLDAILLRALAREPEQRYPSAEALADDLLRWRDGRAVSAQRPRAGYLLGKFVRRHRLAVGAGTAAVLALVVTAGVAVVQGQQAREQAQRAQASRDFLLDLFGRADPDLRAGRDATMREQLEPAEREAERLPPEQRREVLATVAGLWEKLGDLQRAGQVQARLTELWAAEQARRPTPAGTAALVQSQLHEARRAVLMERLDAAERHLRAAEQTAPRAGWPPAVRALADLQWGYFELYGGRSSPAVSHFGAALEWARAGGDPLVEAQSLAGLQRAHVALRRPAEALAAQRALAELVAQDRLQQPQARQDALFQMATTLFQLGRYAEGWPLAEQMAAGADALYGQALRGQLRTRLLWLKYGLQLGRNEAMSAWLRAHEPDAAQLAELQAGYPDSDLTDWHRLSARAWAVAGDAGRAEAELQRARRQAQRLPPASQRAWHGPLEIGAAHAALTLGQPARALALLDPLWPGAEAPSPAVRPYIGLARGVALARLQRLPEALEWLQRAERDFAALGDPLPPQAALVQLNLALLALQDRGPDAAALTRRLDAAARSLPVAYGPDHPAARLVQVLAGAARAADASGAESPSAALRRVAGAHRHPLFF